MEEYKYSVLVGKEVMATGLTLEIALILTQALFGKWYEETDLAITIQRTEDLPCHYASATKKVEDMA